VAYIHTKITEDTFIKKPMHVKNVSLINDIKVFSVKHNYVIVENNSYK